MPTVVLKLFTRRTNGQNGD